MFDNKSFEKNMFNPASGEKRLLAAAGKENPDLLVATFMAQPDASLRKAAIELYKEKNRILLPLLFKLSDPDWGVRDTAAKALFSLLGKKQNGAEAPHFTTGTLLSYAENPIISPDDPAYKPLVTGDPLHSIASISRFNARSGVLRIMQLVVESDSFDSAERGRVAGLREELAGTILESCRTTQLRKLSSGDELTWNGKLPPNPLGKDVTMPFVGLMQNASLYYTLVGGMEEGQPVEPSDARAFSREKGRSGPMNRTIRGIALLEDSLKEYLLLPRIRDFSAIELADPRFY